MLEQKTMRTYQNGLVILMGIHHWKEYYFHVNNFGPLVKYKVSFTAASLFHIVQKIITRQLSQFFLVPFMHQSIPAVPRPSRATAGHLLALLVLGVGHLQILHCPGAGHLPTPGLFPNFWHARGFLSEYNYTEDFAGKNKHISSSIKDRKKLKRVIKACSRFYACISCCLLSQNYEAKAGAIDVSDSTFFS